MANASSINPEPRLPPELEYRIFEIAAMACPVSIPRLMLVAWRIKDWVEPLLYRVVFLDSVARKVHSRTLGISTFPDDAVQQCPPTSLQQVQHLFIGYTVERSWVENWLTACSGVTNLFAQFSDYSPGVVRALGALHSVQYLTIDTRAIFNPAVPHSLFFAVTHLDLLDPYQISAEEAEAICARLALIPHPTHFAYRTRIYHRMSHAGLHADTRLKCIVFLFSGQHAMPPQSSALLDDSRFVAIQRKSYSLDWLRGAASGADYWALADAFIAARQAGKVHRSRYKLSDSDREDSWWT